MSQETLSTDLLPALAHASREDWVWVDVRTEAEFHGPAGHVAEALHVPLGMPLLHFLDQADSSKAYLFVCAHGYRSTKAALLALEKGVSHAKSLKGGMEAWAQQGFSVEVSPLP
ncbi:MAG: rhodanese-like domain-containing protein [Alphaproteobacteria bacterium]